MLGVTVLVNAWNLAGQLSYSGAGPSWQNMVMLLSLGPGIYYYRSRWRIRHTQPLGGSFRAAAAVIGRLRAESRISPTLQVRLGPRLGARVFVAGLPDRPFLVFGPELLALADGGSGQRSVFEVVVRHELAHLRAGDLRWYQLATALRVTNAYAAVWVVVRTGLAVAFGQAAIGQLAGAMVRAAGLVLLAELIGRTFLRVREHHADLHAADHAGTDAVRAVVRGGPESVALRGWLRRHPGATQRNDVLSGQTALLASGPGQVFLGAVTAGLLLVTLRDLDLAGGTDAPEQIPTLVGLLVGLPLTLFVAITVWRSAWHAAAVGTRRSAITFAGALAAGLVLGSHMSPYSRVSGAAGIPLEPVLLIATGMATLGLCVWLAALGTMRARADPAASRLGPFLVGAGLCACVVGGWLTSVLWTWATRLGGPGQLCGTKPVLQECHAETTSGAVARSIGADFAFTPYALIALSLVAISLVTSHGRPRLRIAVPALIMVAAVAAALWQIGAHTAVPRQPSRAELRPVLELPAGEPASADQDCPAEPPGAISASASPLAACSLDGKEKYWLGPVAISGADITGAAAQLAADGTGFTVTITFTPGGSAQLAELTTRSIGGRIAILVDGRVVVAPTVDEPIRIGAVVVQGNWSRDEAESLAAAIGGG